MGRSGARLRIGGRGDPLHNGSDRLQPLDLIGPGSVALERANHDAGPDRRYARRAPRRQPRERLGDRWCVIVLNYMRAPSWRFAIDGPVCSR